MLAFGAPVDLLKKPGRVRQGTSPLDRLPKASGASLVTDRPRSCGLSGVPRVRSALRLCPVAAEPVRTDCGEARLAPAEELREIQANIAWASVESANTKSEAEGLPKLL